MARNKNAHGNRQQNKKRRETLFAYSWSLPSLVLILLIVIFPILYTGYISMTNMNIYHWNNYEFIGLENYKDALLVFDNGFLTALLVTILWTVVNMVLQLVIAFIMATLLNIKGLRLRNVYRTLLIFPWAMPGYVSILLWKTGMFNSQFGLLNQWMIRLGMEPVRWLGSDVIAFISCTTVNLWLALPFMITIIDGALQSVDRSFYESALLDGATWLERTRYITVPMIRSIIAPSVMITTFTTFKQFDVIYLLTQQVGSKTKVKYRPRYKQPEFKVDRGCRIGRSYTDFQKFLETKPESAVVQMDSVIGRVGGKCLLTIHFVETSLMLAFLRDSNTSASVIQIINLLDKVLGNEDFSRLFPVILTDNGSEFSNPKAIEKRDTIPCSRTNVFYCDPSAPYQKGACEVNHELIRRILPKGSSFDDLTQKDIFLMMDHINSYKRKKLNNRSPYETFSFYYGEDILKKLGCKPVAAENIILKPKLLKK